MDISREEEICKASLRLFKLQGQTGDKRSLLVKFRSQHSNKLITSKEISCDESGWQSFDVTDSVKTWVSNPNSNKGFKVERLDKDDPFCDIKFATNEHEAKKPILVIFSNDAKRERCLENKTFALSINRTKRKYTILTKKRLKRRSTDSSCRRVDMTVEFNLAWSYWDTMVIKPKVKNIYKCSGNCKVHSSKTIHALVQSILSETQPASLPNIKSPCCAPNDFRPMAVLFVISHVPTLKFIKNMIVSSCACR